MSGKKAENGGQVVIQIEDEEAEEAKGSASKGSESSPEIWFSPSPYQPSKVPTSNETLSRWVSLQRSNFSKSKSRFGEPSLPVDETIFAEDSSEHVGANFPYWSPRARSTSIASNNMFDEDEEIYKKVELQKEKHKHKHKHKRVKIKVLVELIVFFVLLGCLVASLTIKKLEKWLLCGFELWKWCVPLMVTFCGMLMTHWFMRVIVFVIERNFFLRKKVLYYVHGLKKSVQVFIWLGLVLLTWVLLFNNGVNRSKTAAKVLAYVTWTLVSFLIGAFLWLVKTLSLEILASNFNVNTFFDRIQESVFHQYILQTLSGPSLIEEAERVGRSLNSGQISFGSTKKGKAGKEKEVIEMGQLHKMKQEKISAWTMKVLVDAVTRSGISMISKELDEIEAIGDEQTDKKITNEMEATVAAYHIFRNISRPGIRYIDEDDLLRFMIKEEVLLVFPLFEGWETGKIDREALTDWVVKVYNARKSLAHALNDTKTAVKQLNKLLTGIVVLGTFVIWLMLLDLSTTKVFVFLSSQLIVAAFMIKNTCSITFEAIVFVFVIHPFDVGDLCVVDGTPMLVEEMNILTTIFLKLNNEKVYYPNSVLSTKPISNYYRSQNMGDMVEFSIDFMTPVEKIGQLKDKIKKYLENNPHHWHPTHDVVVNEIENVNKLKMALCVSHTISFQEFAEKTKRRTELVMEIKRLFGDLKIKYYLLPQEVHFIQSGSDSSAANGLGNN
ncbi:hypothetical protein UlMin_035721 [Ulmus minor]